MTFFGPQPATRVRPMCVMQIDQMLDSGKTFEQIMSEAEESMET
jgi:hypothetical protein